MAVLQCNAAGSSTASECRGRCAGPTRGVDERTNRDVVNRVTQAMMKMVKLDIALLEAAAAVEVDETT